MTLSELRQKYLDFFKSKGHEIIPSASLIPENDPSTLFTGSGMQPMVPYLLGQAHPLGSRLTDSQKCFRAQDIDEVGDNRHTTFFEMLGNWSLGDYFKREQIAWMYEFLTREIGLDPKRLYVTVFRGSEKWGVPRDEETVGIWQAQFAMHGVAAEAVDRSEERGMQNGRIFFYDEKKNWWSRSGVPENMPEGEPGGPDTEMFWDFGEELKLHESSKWSDKPCHVNCDCGRFVEIGNNVFMEYVKTGAGFEKLAKQNVDFGGGLERCLAAQIDDPDIYRTNVLATIISGLEGLSGKKYGISAETTRSFRIIADHVRAATFIIGDPRGVIPSNVGQGYVVRRLLRRAVREGRRLGIEKAFLAHISSVVIGLYGEHYVELETNRQRIVDEISKEEEKFDETIEKGLKKLRKLVEDKIESSKVAPRLPDGLRGNPLDYMEKDSRFGLNVISGYEAFDLYQSQGFPLELIQEELHKLGVELRRIPFVFNVSEFREAEKRHQELSRTASAGAFKGGLQDHTVETTRLHTATHLLHQALRQVLGEHVAQKGSNITGERLRFDFSHGQKMTTEEIKQVEDIVNDVIKRDLPVTRDEMTVDEAKASGAIGLFEQKYGDKVSVYTVGDFSKEICGGPHVTHTGELGSFKILKEEAVSAGVRRIKANVGV